MSDPKKKLQLLEIRQAVDAPTAKGIRIHPETWSRLIQSVPPDGPPVRGASQGQANTFSGKPVILDGTLEEETFEIIKTNSVLGAA